VWCYSIINFFGLIFANHTGSTNEIDNWGKETEWEVKNKNAHKFTLSFYDVIANNEY
jgi:hypothetical protein